MSSNQNSYLSLKEKSNVFSMIQYQDIINQRLERLRVDKCYVPFEAKLSYYHYDYHREYCCVIFQFQQKPMGCLYVDYNDDSKRSYYNGQFYNEEYHYLINTNCSSPEIGRIRRNIEEMYSVILTAVRNNSKFYDTFPIFFSPETITEFIIQVTLIVHIENDDPLVL